MSRKTPPSARPVDVLIASKQEWSSRSLASILAPQGYHVVKTYTRVQAITHIRRNPPDAIIIDEDLPDGDGHALCRDLYEQGLISPSTPVFLALSRSPTRRDRLAALRAGAWACLGDPLDAEELLAALDVFVLAKLDADHARTTGLVDEMTGVYNTRGLTRRAEELGAHAARLHRGLGCVLIAPESEPPDGTDRGAPTEPPLALLRRIAAALRAATRQSDAIGRVNSNAFAVVAVDTDAAQARRLAERLVTAVLDERHPTVTALPRFRLRVGYHGVTDFHVAAIDSAELMLRASAALQKARTDQPDAWIQQYID